MTLVEFIAPLRNKPRTAQCLAVLYYSQHHEDTPALSASDVRAALRRARIPGAAKVNTADALSRAGHHADSATLTASGHKLWQLTQSGEDYVRELLSLVKAEAPATAEEDAILADLLARLSDPVIVGYLSEAVMCLRAGALRACIVFLWSGAIRTLQDEAIKCGSTALTEALQKHDPNSRQVAKVEDFAAVKDATLLLACRELGLLDKGQWQTLSESLALRNRCGHPTKYQPGVKRVASYVEDVTGIVFI